METLIKLIPRTGKFWSWAFASWFATLTFLSSRPGQDDQKLPFDIPHLDKIVHFGYFFGGAGLLAAALHYGKEWPWKKLFIAVPLILSLIGIYDEWHQSFTPNRTGNDFGDWLADTLGALLGVFVFKWCRLSFLKER